MVNSFNHHRVSPRLVTGALVVLLTASSWTGTRLSTAASNLEGSPAEYIPDVTFTLKTSIAEGKMVFIGVGGSLTGSSTLPCGSARTPSCR